MVLNDIIDQVSERPQSKATHFSSAYQVKAILFLFSYFNTLLWVSFQDDDDEGPKMKDIVFDCIKRTSDVMCVWDCCWLWIRTAEVSAIYLFLLFFSLLHLTSLLPGAVNNCVWPLHGALHHTVYRGQCFVHERWSLWRRIWWNVSISKQNKSQ